MTQEDLVFNALVFRRYVGADLASIRADIMPGDRRKLTEKKVRAVLERMEKKGTVVQVGQKWFLTPTSLKLAKGNALPPEWRPEDSLILMALFLCAGDEGCELEGILGGTDYIDRSYPTLAEMHGALNRLAAGGLVKTRRGRYLVTEKAAGIFAKVEACCKRGVRSRVHGLERLLECPCCGVELKKVSWRIHIDDAALKEALARYAQRHRSK